MTTKEMTGIQQSTLIDAPIEKVFAYFADPSNLPEIWPSLLDVKDIEWGEDGLAKSWRWVYKMAGMKFDGRSDVIEMEPNKRSLVENKGGLEGIFETTYEAQEGKTLVVQNVRYRVPIPLLGRVAERALEKMNENELATIHANLKARMENDASAA